jgi:hypothetical protein
LVAVLHQTTVLWIAVSFQRTPRASPTIVHVAVSSTDFQMNAVDKTMLTEIQSPAMSI